MSEQKQQVPSVGRVVHFVYGEDHVPAIIVAPEHPAGGQLLFVMYADGHFTGPAEQDEETKAGGTWHWPEYVPAKATQ